jgi:hypothetical protein
VANVTAGVFLLDDGPGRIVSEAFRIVAFLHPTPRLFADGMTDALGYSLEGINELRVISRTSSMHYRGSNKPLPEIA